MLLFQVLETWYILYTDSAFLFEAATLQVFVDSTGRAPWEEAGVPLGWEHCRPAALSGTNQRNLAQGRKIRGNAQHLPLLVPTEQKKLSLSREESTKKKVLWQREARRGGKALYGFRDSEALSHLVGLRAVREAGGRPRQKERKRKQAGEGLPLRGLLRSDPVYQGLTELAKEGRSQTQG